MNQNVQRSLATLLLLLVACGEKPPPREASMSNAGGGTGEGGAMAGGSTSMTGSSSSTSGSCGLPSAGAPGVAKPVGAPGGLSVLSWAGFKAAVSYTFDDANSSQIAHYDELKALGVPFSFYLITGKAEAASDTWAQALEDGHELGNHTKSHVATATGADIDAASDFIRQKFGVTARTMAAPMGDLSYAPLAKTRFLINRGVSNALIAPNDSTDPFNLPCYIPPARASEQAFNDQIDSARSAERWRVVLVHGFTGGTDGAYLAVGLPEFIASVNHAKSFGDLWLGTVATIGAYWRGQKAFSAALPMQAGDVTTWTWTLPEHFPPGQCLRVRVDGGTLTQAGSPLAWDEHGYYEVPLDHGTLTLSP